MPKLYDRQRYKFPTNFASKSAALHSTSFTLSYFFNYFVLEILLYCAAVVKGLNPKLFTLLERKLKNLTLHFRCQGSYLIFWCQRAMFHFYVFFHSLQKIHIGGNSFDCFTSKSYHQHYGWQEACLTKSLQNRLHSQSFKRNSNMPKPLKLFLF